MLDDRIVLEQNFSLDGHELDHDHRVMIDIVNKIVSLPRQFLSPLYDKYLSQFIDVSFRHFDEEIRLMRHNEYPEVGEHEMEHENFKRTVLALLLEGEKEPNYQDMARYLRSWLASHIKWHDRHYVLFMEKKRATAHRPSASEPESNR